MVFKKYIRKNGKIFGPYLYENKRINGKVVTTYVGIPSDTNKAKNKIKINYNFLLIFFLVILLLFFIFQGFSTTGRAALDIKSKYKAGENLVGSLKFNLKAGELIPKDSKIKISFGGAEYEKNFNELVNEDITNGKFYVEGLNLTGEGEGYGIKGKGSSNVEFELKIINKQEDENISGIEKGESKEDEKADEKKGKEERTNETIADEEESEIGGETIEKEGEKANEDNAKDEESLEEKPNEDIGNEKVDESSGTSEGETGSLPSTEESESESESSDSSGSSEGGGSESGESASESGGDSSSITGAVISEENANIISGVVAKNKKFTYNLEEGQTAEIVSGSVKVNGVVINDNEIKLKLKEKEIEVTTDYSEGETGFGEKYLGENVLILEVDLSKFNIIVNESSELKIELVYEDDILVKASEEVSVEEKIKEKNKTKEEIEIVNETSAKNETPTNKIINETTTNIIANISTPNVTLIENISVNITQFSARLGEPVKWIKKINMSGPATIIVDIPLSANNISIKKIEKLQDIAEEDANENIDNDLGSDNSVIANETNETINKEINETEITENDNKENHNEIINNTIAEKEDSESDSELNNIEKEERKIKISISGDVTADIELKKQPKIIIWLKKLFSFTGFVVSEEANNTKEVVVELNSTEEAFEIEYYTDAPSLGFEEEIEHGKRVQVSSPEDVHYENVLLFTNLSEKLGIKSIRNLKVYWNENESYIPIYNASDIDGNEIIDYVEWIAPHLSNQTYDVIVIVKAEHLDVNRSFISDIYDEVRFLDRIWSEAINDGEYVRVVFEKLLNKNRDITVYPRVVSGSPLIEVYEFNKDEKIAEFIDLKSNKYNKVYLTNLNGEQDTFDLRVVNGTLEFDYIVDPITLVQNATFGHTAASPATNAGAKLSSSPTADNLLVIAIASDKSAGTYTVPNGFTLIDSNSATSVSGAMAYKISNGTELSANWTYTTSQESAVWYAEYSGLATSSVLNLLAENTSFASADATTTKIYMENMTNTAQADELAVAMYAIDSDSNVGTESWSNGFTKVVFVNPPSAGTAGLGAADKTLSFIGTVNTTFSYTGGTADQMYGILATFKAASDTTPPIVTIVFPTNTTYNSANLPLNFNVSLNENGSVIYSLNNGAINVSMTSTDEGSKFGKKFNMTNTSIGDGGYRFSVYANDTSGNKNYTAKGDFSFLNTNINSCQNLNTANMNYNLTANVSATGNCFNVTEENITLLGNGFTATFNTGNAATAGINVTKTNFTLRDLKLTTTLHTGRPAGMQILSNLIVNVKNVNITLAGQSNDYAIEFTGQNSTAAIFDSYLGSGVSSGSDYELAFIGTGNNVSLVNVTLKNLGFVWNNTNSFFTRDYYLDVQVNDSNNQGIQNANVSAWDVNGKWQFSILTGNKGVIDQQHLANNKTNTSGGFFIYNNHTINATGSGYNNGSQSWNMTTHRYLLFNLTNATDNSPTVALNTPANGANSTALTINFNFTANDDGGLVNATLYFNSTADSAPISLVQQVNKSHVYLSPATNIGAKLASAPTANNLLIIAIGSDKNAGTYTVPNGFTLIATTSATSISGAMAYKISNGTEQTANWTYINSEESSVWYAEYSGLVASNVLDISAHNTTFSGANTATTVITADNTTSTSQADELAIAFATIDTPFNCDTGRNWSNGFSEVDFAYDNLVTSGTAGISISSKTLSSIGAQSTVYSCSDTGDQMYAIIATFKASSGIAWHANKTITISGTTNTTNITQILLDNRTYAWNIQVCDTASQCSFNNTNYTLYVNTSFVGAADTTPPVVTIVFPTNTTYNSGNLPLNFNVSLDENGSVIYSLNNGVINVSMTSTDEGSKFGKKFNMTNTSIGNGGYRFSVYANDTAGNKNYTAKADFSFDGTYPNVNFVNPTLSSGIYTNNGSVEINVSLVESLLGEVKFNWNGTNYTYYDNSLYALVNFGNYSVLGENDTHVKDFSIYGNNGTVQGGIFWNATKGKYFGAYDFVNANNYIAVGGAGLPSIPDLYTIEAWAYFNDYSDGFGMIWSRNNNTGNVIFNLLGVRNSSGRLDVSHNNNLVATTGISVSTRVWNHYIARYNSSTFSLFINGVERYKEVAGAITLPTTCAILLGIDSDSGCEASFGSDDLNGSVDNFMFYNRSLSDDEIRQHYFMNLYKYNSSNWVLYINQSQNSSTGLTDGNYTYLASAKDRAGNENVSKTRSVFVDRTPALVLINSPANNSDVTTPTAFLNWNVTDAGNNNEIWVYGKNDTSNIFNFLIYHQQAQANGTFNYNWSGLTVDPNSAKLTLLYHFDNNSIYKESLGLVYDFTGGTKNATCSGTGCPTFNFNGKFAGNMKFDGVDDGLVVSDDAAGGKLDYLINFTILGWVNMTGNGVLISSGADGCDNNPVITKGHGISEDTDNDLSFYIGINASTRKICFDMEATTSANNPVSSTTTFDNSELHHFAAVYNGSTSMIYVDGVLESSLVWAGTPTLNNSHDVGIGRSCNHQTCTNGAFNGTIDEIALFNRSLTTAEIRNYYNLSLGRKYWIVNATDIAGNVNGSGTYEFNMTVTADTTPPIVTINLPLAGINLSTSSVNFNVTLNEAGDTCLYSLNLGAINVTMTKNGNTDFNATNTSLGDRSYTVNYYCNDTAGNLNGTASRAFAVDTTFPLISYQSIVPATGAQKNTSNVHIAVDIVENNFKNISFDLYNSTGSVNNFWTTYFYVFELSRYKRIINDSNLDLTVDSSGMAYNPINNTLFVIHNTIGSESIQEIYPNGTLKRNISLTGFHDTEGISYLNSSGGTHRLIVTEEQRANISIIFIDDSTTTIALVASRTYDLGIGAPGNTGIEGVSYDWGRRVYYVVKEKSPMEVYQVNISTTPVTTTYLFNATQVFNGSQGTNFTDLSDIFYDNNTDTLFILSHESQAVANVHLNGTIIRNLSIAHMVQPEGITFNQSGAGMFVIGEPDNYSTWYAANFSSQYNFTSLVNNTYFYNATVYDHAGNSNTTATRNITLGTTVSVNVAPNNATPIINSTDGSNRTGQNLNCFDVLSDNNADRMNVTVKWFNGTKDYLTVYYNNSYVNGTLFNAVLNSANTTKGQNWSCGMRFFDGTAYSSWINTTINLTVLNTLPTVTLSSPANGNITTNRTPTFIWSGSDDDSDSLQYELNLTCYSACSGDNRYVTRATIGASTSYTITPYLKYLIDNSYSYNWTVRAWDGVDYGDWVTAERNISIQSVITISLPVASVNFSVLNVTGRDNTSDNSPYPLVLQNDGNSWVNVSVNFTSLFLSTPSPTSNFQFMVRNLTKGCFTPSGTQTTYTNAPLLTTSIINQFNFTGGYQVGCNNVSIDLLVNIPTDESPGDKSSLVTFTSALAEY